MKTFSHTRPVRDDAGEIIGSKPSPVTARTIEPLGHAFGCDRDKRLILTCLPQDLICLRPERTTRGLCIAAKDLYSYLIRCRANIETLAKARAKKERKATRLAAQRQARAERRLFADAH